MVPLKRKMRVRRLKPPRRRPVKPEEIVFEIQKEVSFANPRRIFYAIWNNPFLSPKEKEDWIRARPRVRKQWVAERIRELSQKTANPSAIRELKWLTRRFIKRSK